jgi:hypothetical protein
MLLDPSEEEFRMSSTAIEIGNGLFRQNTVVGKKYKLLVVFCVVVSDSPDLWRVSPLYVKVIRHHSLVACTPVDLSAFWE